MWQSWPIPGLIRPSAASTGVQSASKIAYEYPARTLSTAAADLRQNSTFKKLKSRGLLACGRVLWLCRAAQRREGAPAAAAAPQRARRAQITRARARKLRIVTTTGHTGSPAHHEQGGRRRREAKKSGPRLSSFRCLRVACAVPAFLLRCGNSTGKASNGRPQDHSSGRGVTGCDRPPFARERSAHRHRACPSCRA